MLWIAWLAWGFDALNNLAPVRQRLAEAHGAAVLRLEDRLGVAPEHALNGTLQAHHALRELVVLWYENVHAGVTFALFAWLWWRRADLLAPMRSALVAVNLAALVVFWSWPVAPPRMLAVPRFTDLVAAVHGLDPHWAPGSVSIDSNQLSALPSLHLAWALWCSFVIFRLTRRPLARLLACGYPIVTAYAVMATANHYLADVLSGALFGVASVIFAERVHRRLSSGAHRSRSHSVAAPDRAPGAGGEPL
ncbi:MAG: phosphatase PAP2 family protein [Solirubrobacteraceae bacterium]